MSHIIRMKNDTMKDLRVLKRACQKLGLVEPVHGTAAFYSATAAGYQVHLPGWRYPVVISDDGTIAYDNFNGYWGDIRQLERLQQEYAAQAVEMAAFKQGQCYQRCEVGDDIVYYIEV